MIISDRRVCIYLLILLTLFAAAEFRCFIWNTNILLYGGCLLLLHQRGLCTDCITSCVIIKLTFSKMYIKTENFKLNASGKQFSSLNVLVWRSRVKSVFVQFVLTIIVCIVVAVVTHKTLTGVMTDDRKFLYFIYNHNQLLIKHTT